MVKFYFYLGNSYYEFERPDISDGLGAKLDISIKKYKAIIRGANGMQYVLKQNDTLPAIEAQLTEDDGTPVNLEYCGVHLHMRSLDGKKIIKRPAEIVDVEQGKVKVVWQEGETETADIYKCEFQINFTDFSVLTVPNDGHFIIKIVNEIV